MIEAPKFWYKKNLSSKIQSILFFPLSILWILISLLKNVLTTKYKSRLKVICIGNLTIGGTGKTPFAIYIYKVLKKLGYKPVFLTRGYGGLIKGPITVKDTHNFKDIGDEALLLNKIGPTIVSKDRSLGARLIEKHKDNYNVIIMDDGLQNYQLMQDIKFLLVDKNLKFGNEFCIPAGPLREPASQGLMRIDAIVLTGNNNKDIDQVYKFHKNDTLNKSRLEVYNSVLIEEKQYKFQQSSLDEFFGEGFSSQQVNDKTFLNTLKIKAGLNAKFDKLGDVTVGLIFRDEKYSLQNFEIEDYVDPNQSINSSSLYLSAGYSKKIKQTQFNFSSSNYLFGDSESSSINSSIELDLKKKNSLKIALSLLNSTPDYNHSLFSSNYVNYNWDNEFQNIKTKALTLNLRLDKIINLDVDYMNIANHIQFEQIETGSIDNGFTYSIKPIQHESLIDLLKIKLNRSVSFGKFSIDSSLMFQKSISNDLVNVPNIISRNTIYFSSDLFKKALYLQTGFGVKYFSKFYMNGYDPLISELYIQRVKEIGDFPMIDFFINAKIQQTRLYFKFEHLNSSLTGYNFYSAPNYPYRDFTFRFGLVWNFFM